MHGLTALWLFQHGCEDIIRRYYLIDPWEPYGVPGGTGELDSGSPESATLGEWQQVYEIAQEHLEPWANKVKFMRMSSSRAAREFARESLDLVFIDGDHSYQATLTDIRMWVPKVREDGLIVGHDYYQHWPGIVRAVNESFPMGKMGFMPDTVWWIGKWQL